jgi:4-oxalocrotonate tautomerase
MPHVVVKLLSGRSETQKQRIADAVARAVLESAQCGEAAISVAVEDVESGDWAEKVFGPEIAGETETIYKRPGYKVSVVLRPRP